MNAAVTLNGLVDRGLARRLVGDGGVEVRGVHHDSREVEAGDLFVALRGASFDGRRFVPAAVDRGAVAVAVDAPLDDLAVPQLVVDDPRRALGALAAVVYGDPTAKLSVVGITGTNGKTTTAWLLHAALTALGERPAMLGTIEARLPGGTAPAPYTTPEGDAVARFARDAVDADATHLVMEVSSHALAQHRVDAVRFEVAAFSNLTQDHLDYHGTMEAYFEAKARLFLELSPHAAVINVDDGWGAKLAARTPGAVRVSRVGAEGASIVGSVQPGAERGGVVVEVDDGEGRHEIAAALVGAHNVDNLLLAYGCLRSLGVDGVDAARALSGFAQVPGRLERVKADEDIAVFVDYAHTPDALDRALAALRGLTPGRLWVVFGCGGDRDRDKRPRMGRVAAERADLTVLTSDNPRTEDPFAILAEIEGGLAGASRVDAPTLAERTGGVYAVEEDRERAIRLAVAGARPGDTVLLAGKGHEDYQIRGTVKRPFDDRKVAATALAARGEGA